MPLLLKLETKSSAVRGISFHHKRPWILASLENGFIQLWDYKISAIIREYNGHDGAVRGIGFHKIDPVFVSGGDDKILKVWNVEDKACLSVLSGHCDIIRSCSFHDKYPWIISSSNDKTIRIWNWNIEQCIANLIGHEMAVTGAIFHPTSSIVFSSSKDGTIRLWDITELENQDRSIGKRKGADEIKPLDAYYNTRVDPKTTGLNSISFKESEYPLVAAGSDDNKVVIFNYSKESKSLYYKRRYEGHANIVKSAIFHPYLNYVIGCSDGQSIRIWDVNKFKCIDILRYQNEKFGVLAAHPSCCLFAAGHENGMILFKNRRERPLFCVTDDFVYYLSENNSELSRRDLKTNKAFYICCLETDLYSKPRCALFFNPVEAYFIMTRRDYDRKDHDYEFHIIYRGILFTKCAQGSGTRTVWISSKEFVVLNEQRKIEIRDLSNAVICKLKTVADYMFYAGRGMILLKIEEEYKLFDIEKKSAIASVQLTDEVRYVIWSKSEEYAAFLTKKKLILLNRKLEILCIQEELNNLKSGCWTDESVFVYNTRYQLKYAFISGESGIIKTLDKQLYIFTVSGSNLCCFDRKANFVEVPIESSEYKLKTALFNGRTDEVLQLLESENPKFVGQSMIELLVKYGYSDIALNFEKDVRTRFLLALECGNLEKALEAAELIDKDIAWTTLAEAAFFKGNHKIAEICYQKTNNYGKLSFLYFVTGNTEKLRDLMEVIDDANVQFQIALLIGDIGERIRILKSCDQISLAYLTAATHGYDNEVEELKKELEFKKRPLPTIDANPRFLVPPKPVNRIMENWPVVKFADNIDDPGLGTSNNFENKVSEATASVEARIEEKLTENSKRHDDYGEILIDESDDVSLGGYPHRESPILQNIPGSYNEEKEILQRSPPTSSTHSPPTSSTHSPPTSSTHYPPTLSTSAGHTFSSQLKLIM